MSDCTPDDNEVADIIGERRYTHRFHHLEVENTKFHAENDDLRKANTQMACELIEKNKTSAQNDRLREALFVEIFRLDSGNYYILFGKQFKI